jgi:methylmalonyl-CoA mutase N-terminal domain/subunit
VDDVAPTLFTFLSVTMDFLPEVAKLRAARRVWARMMRETYGSKDPRSEQLRIFAFTAGSTFTAQQPHNNIVRASVEALAAALGGVQTLHVSAYDEALGVPTEAAATLALRTQQVVAFETGGDRRRRPARGLVRGRGPDRRPRASHPGRLDDVARRGGSLACIESGWFATELGTPRTPTRRRSSRGSGPLSGVNRFPAPSAPLDVFGVDPGVEAGQVATLRSVRARRDDRAVESALGDVRDAAAAGENVVVPCVGAVRAYATIGEIVGRLRDVHGAWAPPGRSERSARRRR